MVLVLDGRRMRVLEVDPDLARMWLEQTKIKNRNISWTIVDTYARDMATGNWRPAGDPIRIDNSGNVLDGQKRLHAIIKANVRLRLVVLEGADLDDQNIYDAGQARKPGQQLAMRGDWKHGPTVAAIVRVLLQWETKTLINYRYKPSTAEVVQFAERWRPRVEKSLEHALTIGRRTAISKALTGAFAFKAYDTAVAKPELWSADKVNEFLGLLASGAGMEVTDPILILREQAQRQARNRTKEPESLQLYRLVATWHNWRSGRRYTKLQAPPGPITYDHLKMD